MRDKACTESCKHTIVFLLPCGCLQHLELRGFDKPFPVQSQCIPILMCGRDLIAVAETGSGKTLAYSLPLVRHVLSIKRQYKEYLAKQKEEKLARLEQQQEQQGGPEAADKGTNSTADTTAETKPNQRGKQNKHNGDDEERDRYRKNEKGERMLIYGNFKEGMIGLVRPADPRFWFSTSHACLILSDIFVGVGSSSCLALINPLLHSLFHRIVLARTKSACLSFCCFLLFVGNCSDAGVVTPNIKGGFSPLQTGRPERCFSLWRGRNRRVRKPTRGGVPLR